MLWRSYAYVLFLGNKHIQKDLEKAEQEAESNQLGDRGV